MSNIRAIAIPALVLIGVAACNGLSDESNTRPIRIDGSSKYDGIYMDDEIIGTGAENWVSSEYYGWHSGLGDQGGCYSDVGAQGGDCSFPNKKQVQIHFDTSNCLVDPPAGDPVPPLLAINRMISAIKVGAKTWNGHGSLVTVEEDACSATGGCHQTTIDCVKTAIGSTMYTGSYTTAVTDLPPGPTSGNDQVKARLYSSSRIDISLNAIWRYLVQPPPFGCGYSPTNAQIDKMAKFVAAHEMGHALGFSHFGAEDEIMFPFAECSPDITIPSQFDTALSRYNPSAGLFIRIINDGLGAWDPL